MPWIKVSLIWLTILVLAIVNGIFREAVLDRYLSSVTSLLLSGLLLSIFILLIAYWTLPWCGQLSRVNRWRIGCYWLALTVVFEFTFGRLVAQKPWPELLAQYRFEGGNIWPLVLLVVLLAPQLRRGPVQSA
ncbi:MAG: hypothetical protein JJU20_09100 [Opitutales bacterium]|nr:hypothetical protein [Opitutales bacterium]